MSKQILIDAARPEETRVVVASGKVLEDYDVALASRPQIKGNIYLAKVVRVEASLQAAFVDYGDEKHGFLSFPEIHPDYFQIPVADREAIAARDRELTRQQAETEELDPDDPEDLDADERTDTEDGMEDDGRALADEEGTGEPSRRRVSRRRSEKQRRAELYRNYRVQEVIRNGQLILVQATKERRGNKGAVFTSYISLPGRYTVLMPNTAYSGGVSRKIGGPKDRKRLREVVKDLDVAEGMSVILRTVAKGRTRAEIRRDFDYVASVWSEIRERTLNSVGASLVHRENDLVNRAIRDLFQSDVSEVIVAGENAYRRAKEITKVLSPSKARHVKLYRGELPFFHSFGVERPLADMHRPEVRLPSGGSMVIAQTEALVTVDINSGRAIRERHIEETALNTNLEAVDELARQLRLRDLAGLIVIDFIGMERRRNNEQVEQRLREVLKHDRARTHVGRMSEFGLIEMSRQRLRASLHETQHEPCANCHGHGWTYRPEALALMVLRALECEIADHQGCRFRVSVPSACAQYLSDVMWRSLHQLETRFDVRVEIRPTPEPLDQEFELEVIRPDGTAVSLSPGEVREARSATSRHGERSRRNPRARGSDRENDSERPAPARRTRPLDAEKESREASEERRTRSRNGKSADRRDREEAARPRNERRRAPVRAALDDDTGPEGTARGLPFPEDSDDQDGDRPEGRPSRSRRTPTARRDGNPDAPMSGDKRRSRRRGSGPDEPVDLAADETAGTDRRQRPVDEDPESGAAVRRSGRRPRQAIQTGADGQDTGVDPGSRRAPRGRRPVDPGDDADAAARTGGAGVATDAAQDDPLPDAPRSRRRRRAGGRGEDTGASAAARSGRRQAAPEGDPEDPSREDAWAREPGERSGPAPSGAPEGRARANRREWRADADDPTFAPAAPVPAADQVFGIDDEAASSGEGAGRRNDLAADADSPFAEPSENSLSGRSRRSDRRTRRGSRGGTRRGGPRTGRTESQASRKVDAAEGDDVGSEASPAPAGRRGRGADPAPVPDPFGAALELPGEPRGGRRAAARQAAPRTDATGRGAAFRPLERPGPAPGFDDPFDAEYRQSTAAGPDRRRRGEASYEDPFLSREPALQPAPAAAAHGAGNGEVGERPDKETGPGVRRRWKAFWSRS